LFVRQYMNLLCSQVRSVCVFFGFLRVGEITSQSKGRAGKHVIHVSDIKLVRKQDSVDLHLMIRSSKTDQHSHSTTLIICSQTDKSICPVHLLKGYLEVRQHALEIDSEWRLRTKLYDKRDDFDFHIVNFPFICGNIPATPAYGVYIFQLIRYSRACGFYQDFLWFELTTLTVISIYCIGSCKFNYHTNTTAPSSFLKYIFE